MRSVDEHGKAPGADDLFLAFMIAGQEDPGFIIRPADKTLDFLVRHVIPPPR